MFVTFKRYYETVFIVIGTATLLGICFVVFIQQIKVQYNIILNQNITFDRLG